LSPNN